MFSHSSVEEVRLKIIAVADDGTIAMGMFLV